MIHFEKEFTYTTVRGAGHMVRYICTGYIRSSLQWGTQMIMCIYYCVFAGPSFPASEGLKYVFQVSARDILIVFK